MFRQNLLIFLAAMAVVGGILYFFWVALRDLVRYLLEARQNRQFDGMREYRLEREAVLREEQARRLDNGCEHLFDDQFGALPPDVCCRCGIAKQKPAGDCDHTWCREPGLLPASICVKCGARFGGAEAEKNKT
jgi:hypothetical protein